MPSNLKTHLNFINGEFVAAVERQWLTKYDPVSGEATAQVADSDLMDVVSSVQNANRALVTWLKSTLISRAEQLEKIGVAIELSARDLAAAVLEDLGTPISVTLGSSVPAAAAHFRAHARQLLEASSEQISSSLEPASEFALPVGLIGVITPASDPLVCLASRIAPALAVGNAVIVKVSRFTPATGQRFAQILLEAGLPPGLFSLLQGRGETVGESLIRHPGISTISFMGSTETGRIVGLIAAEAFKKIHLSLGAKNPVLLFSGADLTSHIPQIARLCLGHIPSQSLKASRLFIQETIFKEALELLTTEFEKARQVPLAKPAQAIHYRSAVQLALKENGKVMTSVQSGAQHGNMVKPYLFADLTNCSTLQLEEIAGPFVLASSFKYQHEALKHANVSPYGRVGYIFDSDTERARRVAQKLQTGSVFINAAEPAFDPLIEIPLLKNSGFQPEGGSAMLTFFSRRSKIFFDS